MQRLIGKSFLYQAFTSPTVIVSALGYFVDIYDLVLFSVVRVASLRGIGVPEEQLLSVGVQLLNWQMTGMLLGGILWGVLGDRRGRVTVLYGSILIYSLANLLNACVTTPTQYAALRLLAGLGLAGELGAAITLVSEVLPREVRGYGASLVAGIGVSGAIVGALIGDALSWRAAYVVGGALGLLLLVVRVRMADSAIFSRLNTHTVSRGNFFALFTNGERLRRYLQCIVMGLPIWCVVGILVTFSPEIAGALGVTGPVKASTGILFTYAGLTIGDISSGFLSQWIASRKRAALIFLLLTAFGMGCYFLWPALSPTAFYAVCLLMGTGIGYWAIMMMFAAEQFGTNLRATVTTTVPNFVRGAVVPMTLAFTALKGSLGIVAAAALLSIVVWCLALVALLNLQETYGRDLEFVEHC